MERNSIFWCLFGHTKYFNIQINAILTHVMMHAISFRFGRPHSCFNINYINNQDLVVQIVKANGRE